MSEFGSIQQSKTHKQTARMRNNFIDFSFFLQFFNLSLCMDVFFHVLILLTHWIGYQLHRHNSQSLFRILLKISIRASDQTWIYGENRFNLFTFFLLYQYVFSFATLRTFHSLISTFRPFFFLSFSRFQGLLLCRQ